MINLSDLPLFLYFQFITAVLVVVFYKRNWLFYKILCLHLIITFCVELFGTYLSVNKMHNFQLYHFYSLVEFALILIMYFTVIKDKQTLKFSYLLFSILLVLWGLTFYDVQYFTIMTVIGAFNVGVLVVLYMRELLMSDEMINYKKLLPFWVSIGLIIFYLASIPFMSFWSYMNNRAFVPILHTLIILMNIIISFGLIWSNKEGKSY